MTEYAKIIYSFDLQKEVDRTDTTLYPHRIGNIDIDFKCNSANNPQARNWSYAGTEKTIEKARNIIENKMREQLPPDTEYRIVDAETGEILEKIT
jgi:Fe-S cluster biosynthesis and repair protein YggX